MFSELDRQMMRRALELAELGRYTTQPNPRVGCVVAQGDRIVGEGWHRKSGDAHAEALALAAAGSAAQGATAYVTLEPHSYHSRTPPCTDALIRAGIRRVFCGMLDPNPRVHGEGVRQLQAAGVEVSSGLLESPIRALNAGFEKRMTSGLPRVIVKVAASLDGRVALASGESKWITGEAARADVQRLRAEVGAVLTGIETVLSDNPQLNVRDPAIDTLGRQPLRVVLDTRLRMSATARMLQMPGETLVFTDAARATGAEELKRAGAQVVGVSLDASQRVNLADVLQDLGTRQCNDVLVEAGPTLAGRILQLGLADELIVYVAPVVLGPDARAMLDLPRLDRLQDGLKFELTNTATIGADIKLHFRCRSGFSPTP